MSNEDFVYIKGLKLDAKIGVFAWEQRIDQRLVIDLEMFKPINTAAASDNIDDAINYAAVSDYIIQFAADSQFHLIETFAEKLADNLLDKFQLNRILLRLAKPGAVAAAGEVGVQIVRSA